MITVYFHVVSTSVTAQSSSTLSSPPTGEHVLSAGVYMLVHNVDVCTAGTDTVSQSRFLEAVASIVSASESSTAQSPSTLSSSTGELTVHMITQEHMHGAFKWRFIIS